VGGDVSIHVGDVNGDKPQVMIIRDVCEVIDVLFDGPSPPFT
jgi:hypothetical protein